MRLATSALILSTASGILLSGCLLPQPTDSHWTARDWAPIGKKRPAEPAGVWCYETIGKPDCYTAPLPGQEYRLLEGGPAADPQHMSVAAKPIEAPEAKAQEMEADAGAEKASAKASETSILDRLTGWFDL